MKALNRLIAPLFLVLGLAGAGLRFALYIAATDSKGLLMPFHPLEIMLWVLTFAALLAAIALTRGCRLRPTGGIGGAVGCLLFAVGIVLQCLQPAAVRVAALSWIHLVLGGAAVGSLLFLAWLRLKRQAVPCGYYAVLCLYFCIYMVLRYQSWSELTQLQDYVFALGAALCLTLFAYRRGADAAGLPQKGSPAVLGLMGIFFCCTAVPMTEDALIYAAAVPFLLAELADLTQQGEG